MNRKYLTLIAPNHTENVKGLYSVCCAHPAVLAAAMQQALDDHSHLLVEATPNQVNQFGGYSGLTPMAFRQMVEALAQRCGLSLDRIIFGADHLGPYVWREESAAGAMQKALELTRAFVAAGFSKLHLDAGMPLGGDPAAKLSQTTVARRTLQMMAAAEDACADLPDRYDPIAYVVGAEAPVPGGGVDENHTTVITLPAEIDRFLDRCRREMKQSGRPHLWRQVAAVVVQPGVDFGDQKVIHYDRGKADFLVDFVKELSEEMTCEVHATDYQTPAGLAALVDDGFKILKVGPCLTFAYRQAVYALSRIEAERLAHRKSVVLSHLPEVLEAVMLADPQHWQSHYHGSASRQKRLRHHSLRDRIRYYWGHPKVTEALARLLQNLSFEIPEELLFLHWPEALSTAADRRPEALIAHHITAQLTHYAAACKGENKN